MAKEEQVIIVGFGLGLGSTAAVWIGAAILRTTPRPDLQERLSEMFQLPIRSAEFWHQVGHLLRPLRWDYFYDGSGQPIVALVRKLLGLKWDPLSLMNVNFPDCRPDEVQGVEVTRLVSKDVLQMPLYDGDDEGATGIPPKGQAFKSVGLGALQAGKLAAKPGA